MVLIPLRGEKVQRGGESTVTKVQSCYGACPGQSQHEIKHQLASASMEVIEQRVRDEGLVPRALRGTTVQPRESEERALPLQSDHHWCSSGQHVPYFRIAYQL
jgi:hypothetical protein